MVRRWYQTDDISPWRRISVGMWDPPGDPQIYGQETHPVESLLDYLDEIEEETGVKVTLTTFVIRAIAKILEEYPDLNVMPIGGKVFNRENNDVFCLVATEGDTPSQADLGGVKIRNVDELTLPEVAKILRNRAEKLRAGRGCGGRTNQTARGLCSVLFYIHRGQSRGFSDLLRTVRSGFHGDHQ